MSTPMDNPLIPVDALSPKHPQIARRVVRETVPNSVVYVDGRAHIPEIMVHMIRRGIQRNTPTNEELRTILDELIKRRLLEEHVPSSRSDANTRGRSPWWRRVYEWLTARPTEF